MNITQEGQDAADMKPNTTHPVAFRCPFDLYKWLESQAEAQHRSVTGQINYILDAARQTSQNKAV